MAEQKETLTRQQDEIDELKKMIVQLTQQKQPT
jgi:hypothetical protein